MKTRGFTLVELLAVIVLLVITLGITFPIVYDAIKQGNDTVNDTQINRILEAAYDWSISNPTYLPKEGDSITISLGQLKQAGLIDTNLRNSKTKKLFPNDMLVTIANVKGEEPEEVEYTKYIGDYKITANVDTGKSVEYDEYAPQIILKGDSVIYINKGALFGDPGYTAVTYDNKPITNVTTTYKKGEEQVPYVTTDQYAVFSIFYTAIDGNKKTTVVRSIVITDKEAPTLIVPGSTTISTKVTTFDYMDGVSCTDPQGDCTITYNEPVKLGVKGKYVITYTATDNEGNKTTKKRVITIDNKNTLPTGYQQVAYIQSTGTQYIDTGYYFTTEKTRIITNLEVTSNPSSQTLFGSEEWYNSAHNRYFSNILHGSNGRFNAYVGAGSVGSVNIGLNTKKMIDLSTNDSKQLSIEIDNVSVLNVTYSGTILTHDNAYNGASNKGNIFIFANHGDGTSEAIQTIGGMILYSFKMYDNNMLVRDFVPCYRTTDGVIGLYDKVENKFYTNKGTGTFIKGPEV